MRPTQDKRPFDVESRRWFFHAVRNMAAFAARPRAVSDAVVPDPAAVEDLVAEVATLWSRADNVKPGASSGAIDNMEALSARARELGLQVQALSRSAAALQDADLPAIVLTTAGGGRLLLARRGDLFDARGLGAGYAMTVADVVKDEEGVAILVAPIAVAPAAREEAPEADKPVTRAAAADPVRRMIAHMAEARRGLLVKLLAAAAFSNLMLLAMPVYSGLVFDRVIPHAAFDTLWAVSLGVFIALSADLAVRYVRLKLQDALASETSAFMQEKLTRDIVDVRMTEAPRSSAAVTLRLREIENLAQTVPVLITSLFVDAPFLLVVFGLIWLNGGLIVLAPIVGLALLVLVHHLSNLTSTPQQVRATKLMQFRTNQVIETIDGLERVKTTRSERKIVARLAQAYDDFAYASHLARLWQGFASYSSLSIGQMMVVMVMMIGVYQISDGSMTIGGLSVCTLLVGRVISPIGQLVGVLHRTQQIVASYNTLPQGAPGASEKMVTVETALPAPRRAELRLSDVSFSYPGQTTSQLEKASLVIRPGEKVAIIGRSGSGKSTLLKMFTRLLDPTSGAVLVDDFDAHQYDPTDLRRAIVYMSQSPSLVDDTLLANMLPAGVPVDPARLEAIVRLTGVMEFVARHPQGYGMALGPRGERLSGGEQQSLALARLLLAEPKALILDEPTASMDPTLEARLVKQLPAELGTRTLVVATHRATMLQIVDRVIWMDGGRIVADGPKAEVLARLSRAA